MYTTVIPINKNTGIVIWKELKKIEKINENLRGFFVKNVKNDRGDYGFDQKYYYHDELFFMIRFDGKGVDNAQYYTTTDVKQILGDMLKDAKKKK